MPQPEKLVPQELLRPEKMVWIRMQNQPTVEITEWGNELNVAPMDVQRGASFRIVPQMELIFTQENGRLDVVINYARYLFDEQYVQNLFDRLCSYSELQGDATSPHARRPARHHLC